MLKTLYQRYKVSSWHLKEFTGLDYMKEKNYSIRSYQNAS